jgi:uncharacterized membrane protein
MRTFRFFAGGFIVLLAGFLLIGVFIPTVNYETKIEIGRPVNETFAIFKNDTNLGRWMVGFQSLERLEGEAGQAGSLYKVNVLQNGKKFEIMQRIVDREDNRSLIYELDNETLNSHVEMKFNDIGLGRTQLVIKNKLRGKTMLLRSVFPFFKSAFRESDEINYEQLKRMMERSHS